MIKYLIRGLETTFQRLPRVVSSSPKRSVDFVKELVREVGLLFIVLGDIGVAFEDDIASDITK